MTSAGVNSRTVQGSGLLPCGGIQSARCSKSPTARHSYTLAVLHATRSTPVSVVAARSLGGTSYIVCCSQHAVQADRVLVMSLLHAVVNNAMRHVGSLTVVQTMSKAGSRCSTAESLPELSVGLSRSLHKAWDAEEDTFLDKYCVQQQPCSLICSHLKLMLMTQMRTAAEQQDSLSYHSYHDD